MLIYVVVLLSVLYVLNAASAIPVIRRCEFIINVILLHIYYTELFPGISFDFKVIVSVFNACKFYSSHSVFIILIFSHSITTRLLDHVNI